MMALRSSIFLVVLYGVLTTCSSFVCTSQRQALFVRQQDDGPYCSSRSNVLVNLSPDQGPELVAAAKELMKEGHNTPQDDTTLSTKTSSMSVSSSSGSFNDSPKKSKWWSRAFSTLIKRRDN